MPGAAPATKSTGDEIKCPNCGELIPITETLRSQLAEEARAELQVELEERQRDLTSREKKLEAKGRTLQEAEREIEKNVAARVAKDKARLAADALEKARSEVSTELLDLRTASTENKQKLEEARAKELALRKEKRQLEDAKKELELEVARRLDSERQQVREEALKGAAEQHRLKDAEKDNKLSEALRMNEELRRKLEQGPQQVQGEVLELELENLLRDACPSDEIAEVPKGVRGADVLQSVKSSAGLPCGSILWEAKNTKRWNDAWAAKLKDDQRESKADVAVLVSEVLPKDIDGFSFRDGIWIANRRFVPALVVALRKNLSDLAHARRAAAGKNELVEAIFKYATGPEFRSRVETIANSFVEMRADLEQEKRAAHKRWAKRGAQLDLIVVNTTGMYGELQGLIGSPVRPIAALEDGEIETAAPQHVTAEPSVSGK
ncbi:MAG: DUF2130 domain-containing protein [Candidatus Sulfotelmatobacter sp.]